MGNYRVNIHCFFFILVTVSACQKGSNSLGADAIHELNRELSNIIVLDGFSPPVASRIYAYSNLAFYESVVPFSSHLESFSGRLNQCTISPLSKNDNYLNPELIGIYSFCSIAKKMVYRDFLIDSLQIDLLANYSVGKKIHEHSLAYSNKIVAELEQRMEIDNYAFTRTLALFRADLMSEGNWLPTPPSYSEAIEPNWSMILPFFLDSANQFKPADPTPYSIEKGSPFYQTVEFVYETVKLISQEELEQAKFWDCNPMVAVNNGHLMHVKRQLTPGGHWIGITGTAAKIDSLDLFSTSEVYTNTAIVLADAFISCWEAKYRTNLIRPETYINKYMDDEWRPILETPMFPEYTSGHSVVSMAAATYLTSYFGDNFAYVDSINVPFNLPQRYFTSFYQAAEEAALSRLYGGIHYMQAIEEGKGQGFDVAEFYLEKIHSQ